MAGADSREIDKALVSLGLLLVRGIWFTLPFGKAITIGAKAKHP
jgi:hypothetical protein